MKMMKKYGYILEHTYLECEAYYHNPMDDVIYMRKAL